MSIKAIDGRLVEKISDVPGEVPQIGPSFDHTDGTWVPKDIYEGELFFNITDEKLYIGLSTTVLEITTASSIGLWDRVGNDIQATVAIGSPSVDPNILPAADDVSDLGSASLRWKDLYLGSVIDFTTVLDFNQLGVTSATIDGDGIFLPVTKVLGNTNGNIEFNSAFYGGILSTDSANPPLGPTGFFDLAPDSTSGIGSGFVGRIAVTGGVGYLLIGGSTTVYGQDYEVGDTITYLGTQFGLSSPADDQTWTITSIDEGYAGMKVNGSVRLTSLGSGAAAGLLAYDGVGTIVDGSSLIPGTDDLATTLAAGNTTGGTNIEVTSGDFITTNTSTNYLDLDLNFGPITNGINLATGVPGSGTSGLLVADGYGLSLYDEFGFGINTTSTAASIGTFTTGLSIATNTHDLDISSTAITIDATSITTTMVDSITLDSPEINLTQAPPTNNANTTLLGRNATTGEIEIIDKTAITGAVPLATVLATGNTTGGTNIVLSSGDGITGTGLHILTTGPSYTLGFRTGTVGVASFVAGGSAGTNTASGLNSAAFGKATIASGANSLAGGLNSVASGEHSIAWGGWTSYPGIGTNTASGDASIALGLGCTASGRASIALGDQCDAQGDNSVALGAVATSIGGGSVAMNRATTNGAYSIAVGLSSANGDYSFSGGNGSTASGTESFSWSGLASATNAVSLGGVASGQYSFAGPGGGSVTASGNWSTAGGRVVTANHYGEWAYGTGSSTTNGTAQTGFVSFARRTTNATPVELFLDGSFNGTGSSRFTVASGTAYRVIVTAIALNTTTMDAHEWSGKGIIKNVAGTTSLVSAITLTPTGDAGQSTTILQATADDTNDSLLLTATGIAATNINWSVKVEYIKITQ